MSTTTEQTQPAGSPEAAGFLERLKAFEGRATGAPNVAQDPVNQPMIRHWVEAMGDENPVYVDDTAARAEGFPGVIAPPTMLQAWIMRGYRLHTAMEAERGTAGSGGSDEGEAGAAGRNPQDELFRLLDSAGFTSVVATNCEQRYLRPLVLGDHLTVQSVIESVSDLKHTALGDGHFVTSRLDFADQHGEPVATMHFRILKFRPKPRPAGDAGSAGAGAVGSRPAPATAGSPDTARPRRPRLAITDDIAFFFEGARQGTLLMQRCTRCGRLRHPPLPACPACRSLEWDTVEASGHGTVFSYVVTHHPQVPAFDYPLPIAVVELDEGTRLVADLIDVAPDDIWIGMPVVAELVAVDDELTLPMFRPAPGVERPAATGGA